MLKDIAKTYYDQGYNCAEALIHAGNDYYHLNLCEHDMRMVAAFGGGLQVGDVCGTLNACACILSMRYVKNKAHDQKVELQKLMASMVVAFQNRMGSRLCSQIKPKFHNPQVRCQNTVMTACDVLENVIQQWDSQAK